MDRKASGIFIRYLGFVIDSRLGWTTHIIELCNKLWSVIYTIRRLKVIQTYLASKTTYHLLTLFPGAAIYGILLSEHCVLWGGATVLERCLDLRDSCANYVFSHHMEMVGNDLCSCGIIGFVTHIFLQCRNITTELDRGSSKLITQTTIKSDGCHYIINRFWGSYKFILIPFIGLNI